MSKAHQQEREGVSKEILESEKEQVPQKPYITGRAPRKNYELRRRY